jgi:glycosyltransferase involved in cell wall biosynthesis
MLKTATVFYGGFLHKTGGAFHHARTIASELRRMGWQVECVTLDDLPVWCRYLPHIAERLTNLFNAPVGFIYKARITKALYKHYFGHKVDLQIFEDIYLAWDSEVPSITILHAIWSDNLQAFSIKKQRTIKFRSKEAEIINAISHPVVTVSYPYRQYIVEEHFSSELVKDIEVIELGIDQSIYSRAHKIKRNKKSIVYSGTLEARKNPLFLLEVFMGLYKSDPDYTLTIIGDGPYREQLVAFTKKYGLPVEYLGRVDNARVLSELLRHEIYIHASTKESFSYSLLEAKMAGLTTCAYSKLQVPSEFIDIGIETFSADEWCRRILMSTPLSEEFDGRKYSSGRMTRATLDILTLQ